MTPINDIESLFHDPHFQTRGTFVEVEHPVAGKRTYTGPPFRMTEGGWQIRRPAPMLSQHNAEILGELGYSKDDLVRLRGAGVI